MHSNKPTAVNIPSLWLDRAPQSVTSRDTCVKILPRMFRRIEFSAGMRNVDIGGGRFQVVTAFLAERGVANFVFDPFNRGDEENLLSAAMTCRGQAATATVANVLNVIPEADARAQVIAQAADAVGELGVAYFQVWDGNRSGAGGATPKGWQANRPLRSYLPEIEKVFRDVSVQDGVIVAARPVAVELGLPLAA